VYATKASRVRKMGLFAHRCNGGHHRHSDFLNAKAFEKSYVR
jgi:hypothetical protein